MYLALKPCLIAGTSYLIDDEVDVSMLSEKEIARLIKRKFIVKVGEGEQPTDGLFTVPIITKDETLSISLTGQQLADVVAIIQGTAESAIEAIKKGITAEAPLILIHRLDTRKSVQTAAKERAEALSKSGAGDE